MSSKIEANNQSVSGGRVSELGLQYLVKSSSLFATESDFENLIVGYKPVAAEATASGTSGAVSTSSMDKAPIFLREVATVSFENDRPEILSASMASAVSDCLFTRKCVSIR